MVPIRPYERVPALFHACIYGNDDVMSRMTWIRLRHVCSARNVDFYYSLLGRIGLEKRHV